MKSKKIYKKNICNKKKYMLQYLCKQFYKNLPKGAMKIES